MRLTNVTEFGKTLRMGFFFLKIEFHVCTTIELANPRSRSRLITHFVVEIHCATPRTRSRLIMRFVVEIQHFVCDHATPPIFEKLRVAMHVYSVSAYYA